MKQKNKNLCIIQARMGSTRLPNKVFLDVDGVSLLEYEIKRAQIAKRIDKIVVATGLGKANDKIEELCQKLGIDCFRGSEDDVLDRFFQCSLNYPQYNVIIRLTGDCPLIDPKIIDEVIVFFEKNNFDYASNVNPPSFPDGMDVEVFTRAALAKSVEQAKLGSEREHITQFMFKDNKLEKGNLKASKDFSGVRLTVDYSEDFEVVSFIIKNSKLSDSYLTFIALLVEHPEIMKKNSQYVRNNGLAQSLKKDKIYESK